MSKTKLELTWIDKEVKLRLEPRVLIHDSTKSYHANVQRTGDQFDSRLIFGDNLLALKALEREFTGKVKCVYIDPPYNTGSAFRQYDDGVEHSLWLSLIYSRLEILKALLSPDGSIWLTIDDNEGHYLKVLCDEVFGRQNFLGNIVWQSKDTPGNNSVGIAQTHNHILGYRKSETFIPNLLERNEEQLANYDNPDLDSRGPWLGTPMTRAEFRERDYYALKNKVGKEVFPPKGSSWRRPPEKIQELEREGRIYWGKNGNAEFPVEKKFLSEVKEGVVNQTWWPYEFAGSTRNASAEMKNIFSGEKGFDTPKPEKLIYRILQLATNENDLVLDSFAGSGTTGAVAQKMGRRWIMIEMGEHCHTHIIPRLQKVIDGTDLGGISRIVSWKGGGGFKYYRLAPTLIKKDTWGNEVINPEFNPELVAEAVCKLEGFTYSPNETEFWRHGQSTENDFIYVTTQTLTVEQLNRLSDEVGSKRSLLVCCGAWRAKDLTPWTNLTLKKIPKSVLDKAEWNKDDYSLAVRELPLVEDDLEEIEDSKSIKKTVPKKETNQEDLFSSKPKTSDKIKKKKR